MEALIPLLIMLAGLVAAFVWRNSWIRQCEELVHYGPAAEWPEEFKVLPGRTGQLKLDYVFVDAPWSERNIEGSYEEP